MGGMINGGEAFEGETETWMMIGLSHSGVGERYFIDIS